MQIGDPAYDKVEQSTYCIFFFDVHFQKDLYIRQTESRIGQNFDTLHGKMACERCQKKGTSLCGKKVTSCESTQELWIKPRIHTPHLHEMCVYCTEFVLMIQEHSVYFGLDLDNNRKRKTAPHWIRVFYLHLSVIHLRAPYHLQINDILPFDSRPRGSIRHVDLFFMFFFFSKEKQTKKKKRKTQTNINDFILYMFRNEIDWYILRIVV